VEKFRHKSYVQKVIHVNKVKYKNFDTNLISIGYVHKVRHKSMTINLQYNTETTI
jgi:hypothetical protein